MGISLGTRSYCAGSVHNPWDVEVIVGNYASIADGFKIMGSGGHHASVMNPRCVSNWPWHEMGGCKDYPKASGKGPTIIGSDVWIGDNVTVLDGLTIGHGAIIGTCAVVAKSVPPYAVAVGNPAKVVKYRFDAETIERLLAVAWWDWPEEKVWQHTHLFNDIDRFLVV